MAVLSDPNRVGIFTALMSEASRDRALLSVSKADLQAAVNAADAWAESNAGSYNSALPVAARTNLTAKQKAMLLAYVILRRYEVS